jgi:tRNA(fMet)-specific endonuclease VapC
MIYLLDTCTLSDFVKGHPGVLARLKGARPADLAISAVTLMELEYGLQLNPARAVNLRPVIEALVSRMTVVPFDASHARAAGSIRATLRKQGTPIGAYDVLLAATALVQGMILVTSNTGELQRVGGLRLEDWRK